MRNFSWLRSNPFQCFAAILALSLLAGAADVTAATTDEQKCVNGLAKAAAKLVKTYEKEAASCLKAAQKGKLDTCENADACLGADRKGKVAKALTKLTTHELLKCRFDAPVWFDGGSDVSESHGRLNPAPSLKLFGPSFADAIAAVAGSKDGASCQAATQKSMAKLGATLFKEFLACTKAGLKDASIDSVVSLQACFDTLDLDAKGKIGKAVSKLAGAVSGKCASVDTDAVLPGTCAGELDAGACFAREARCRTCRLLNEIAGVERDCDTFDDGNSNDTCSLAEGRCNGSLLLCDRTFDAVAYPTSHNAMSASDEDWGLPLQNWGISDQLTHGVRSLMLDTHYFEGVAHLCHAECDLTQTEVWREPLVDGLVRIREFLEDRPEEIVSIIFESYISELHTADAFTAAGLDPYLHSQTAGQPWPTLSQMIASDRRLVVLTDDSSAALPWHLYLWTDFAFETHFHYEAIEEFSCADNRGDPGNDLFILNHFLTAPLGTENLAEMVNFNPVLSDRASECQTFAGRIPNFVTVDFSDVGDLFSVVDDLNGLGSCTP